MDKIYVILGKSASGKDTIYQKIVSMCDLVPIVYYTTRPIRAGEVDGKDYFYVTEKEIDAAEKSGKLIEKRTYNTVKGLWTYATINDGQFETQRDGIIVLPPKAYYSFIEYFGKDKIVALSRETKSKTHQIMKKPVVDFSLMHKTLETLLLKNNF